MKVNLIGATLMDLATIENVVPGYSVFATEDTEVVDSADALAEFAGRACYQSWSRPNPKTRENRDYLANVIELGHESVLTHASATFYVTGVSRSLTHELIRHRFLAFSELSQRYVDMTEAEHVYPPAITTYVERDELDYQWEEAKASYESLSRLLEEKGLTHKQAREAARAVLPGMTETKIVVSGNIRAWRDFLRQRLSPQADAEIREFAEEIYKQLKGLAPNSMQGVGD